MYSFLGEFYIYFIFCFITLKLFFIFSLKKTWKCVLFLCNPYKS